ncbi:MAG TPA: NUDIX domain-containing protein [Candidatus Nanoarchaeia archaeon]|nr:NUDIX domain-containing protein [Candidatus Nanoarchaeia archaeon]
MEKSVGAVVFRGKKFLILEYGLGHFDFVKGHIEKGEEELDTLKREMFEETGIKKYRIIPGFRKKISYFYRKGPRLIKKEVVFYLAKTPIKRVKLSFEHKNYFWLNYKDARKKLTYDNARQILDKAAKHLK